MRSSDIGMYRDSGSIEFRVERDGVSTQVWLETPFAGEPHALRIDSITITRGAAEIDVLLPEVTGSFKPWCLTSLLLCQRRSATDQQR
jgi:hypothetical protein